MQTIPHPNRSMSHIAADYDRVAEAYAEQLATELTDKPFDCACLDAFADRWQGQGMIADLGCGPGQVAAYLAAQGVTVTGLDLSVNMVTEAMQLHPGIAFEQGDILALDRTPARFAAAVAFYALVHFDDAALAKALTSIRLAIAPGGEFFTAVHLGSGWIAPGELWGVPVGLRFRMFQPGELETAMAAAGFRSIETLQRDPYPDVEYPSQRAYIRAAVR